MEERTCKYCNEKFRFAKLLGNARVARYLGQHHADIFRELQSLSESPSLES